MSGKADCSLLHCSLLEACRIYPETYLKPLQSKGKTWFLNKLLYHKTGSAALSPRWRCGDGSAASLLRLLLLFVLLGFRQMFVPGDFFGFVHNFSPVSGNLATARVATTFQPSWEPGDRKGRYTCLPDRILHFNRQMKGNRALLFGFVAAFKIDLCHLVSFVSTVVVFVIVT